MHGVAIWQQSNCRARARTLLGKRVTLWEWAIKREMPADLRCQQAGKRYDEQLNANFRQEVAMKVKEAMTRDVRVANPDDTLRKAARIMASLDAGVLPVGENDQLIGM